MNLFQLIKWTVHSQKFGAIPAKGWLRNFRQIRWQTTDAPPREEPAADVSTKVTPTKQSNLMEFFDTSDNARETKVIHGKFPY